MAWLDLLTGVVHGAVVYRDAAAVILWSPDGEAQVSAEEFGQLVAFDAEAYAPEIQERMTDLGIGLAQRKGRRPPAALARFQDLDPGATLPPAAETRRAAIATYAADNGGQILVHRNQNWQARVADLARRGRDLFGGGGS